MELETEFILNGYQYQKVSNNSWDMPMFGYRKRKLDRKGNAISKWENIDSNDFNSSYKLNEKRFV